MSKPVLIGDFLHRIRRPIDLDPASLYKLVTVKLKHKGVVLRGEKLGADIKSKMYQVNEGDFILSGIDARNGAFGIVPPELDGAVVTNDFWYFEIDDEVVDKSFFLELTSTYWFDEICRKGSDGTTQRIRLQKAKFFNQTIYLPELSEQRKFNKRFQAIKASNQTLSGELTHQQTLLKKLRQQILQEAIEGKLTADWRAQHPDVEPACELLKRIAAEKAQLVKDKKIKKQKPLLSVTDEKKPFDLPQGWEWCRLEESGVFERGKSKHRPRNDPRLFENGYFPFVQTGDIARSKATNYRVKTHSQQYNDFGLAQSRIWHKETLCITIAANIAETGFLDFDACFPDSVVGFSSISELMNSFYVKYFIDATRDEIEKFAPATAQKNINLGIINMLLLPLPPLDEQQAIVTKVEKMLALCNHLETKITQNQSHAEQLMQAVLKEAFAHNSRAEAEAQNNTVSSIASEVIRA